MDRPGSGMPPWERRERRRLAMEQAAQLIQYARDHQGAMPPGSWVPGSEIVRQHGLTESIDTVPTDDGGDPDG